MSYEDDDDDDENKTLKNPNRLTASDPSEEGNASARAALITGHRLIAAHLDRAHVHAPLSLSLSLSLSRVPSRPAAHDPFLRFRMDARSLALPGLPCLC